MSRREFLKLSFIWVVAALSLLGVSCGDGGGGGENDGGEEDNGAGGY